MSTPRTLREVFENALQPLDVESASMAPVFIRERVMSDINAAFQLIATSDRDYFTRETQTVNLTAGTSDYAVTNVLNVLLPARLSDGTPLRELTTRGELDMFGQLFLGQTALAVAQAKPMAVFVERKRQAGSNPVSVTLCFAPTPNLAYTAKVDVTRVPPVYTLDQVSDPSPEVCVPHQFVESILMPIVRWNIRTSHFFTRKDMLDGMESQYQAALQMLGIADPQVKKPGVPLDLLELARNNARGAARKAYQETMKQ